MILSARVAQLCRGCRVPGLAMAVLEEEWKRSRT